MDWSIYSKLVESMTVTCKVKNNAYSDSFHKSCYKYGAIAGLVRIEDKLNRLSNLLLKGGPQNDEKNEDTCIDAANYLLLLATWLSESKDNTQGTSPDQSQGQQQGFPLPPFDELIERLR